MYSKINSDYEIANETGYYCTSTCKNFYAEYNTVPFDVAAHEKLELLIERDS